MTAVETSRFKTKDLLRSEARPVEILAGGFIQVQEYRVARIDADKGEVDTGRVNYGVNVWGPVQCPIKYKPLAENSDAFTKALETEKKLQGDYNIGDRQMTFTFRGRRTDLSNNAETVRDNRTFRWHSWWDPAASGKTSLLKFSFCEKDEQDQKKSNKILVESWCIVEKDPKTDQQWTQYET